MTAQASESLRYEGQNLLMCSQPLDDYFAIAGIDPGFTYASTALWRGYIGSWEIVDGRLYLVALQGELYDGCEVSLAMFFPDFPTRVFAHWYSDTIRVPQGKMLKYVHQGYRSTYERDLFLKFEKGVVKHTRVRHNGTAEEKDALEGYQISTMTIFPRSKP